MALVLEPTSAGLYCRAGGFHVDPWEPVERAIVTHAHADHARPGSVRYLASSPSVPLLRRRFGPGPALEGLAYGQRVALGDAIVSLHPAGHVLGSAQVRIEVAGEVWVVAGDYKRADDPTCPAFERVACHTFITEATFALPIYRWPPAREVAAEILSWWDANREAGRASVLFAYALGKSQRVLAELARLTDRPVLTHGAVEALTQLYRDAGIALLPTRTVVEERRRGVSYAGELILAPPSALGSPWMRRFGDHETAFASGWMRLRGTRRRRGFDRGFVLSDHADWSGLLATIRESGAERILASHGYAEELTRYLREQGLDARGIHTAWEGEADAE